MWKFNSVPLFCLKHFHTLRSNFLKKAFSNILGWITKWRVASQANLLARRTWSFEVRCHERAKIRVILRSNKRCSRCRDGERLVTE